MVGGKKKKSKKMIIGIIFLILILSSVVIGCVFGLMHSIASMEHYLRVWDKPLEVIAVVTKHDSYDDDGSNRYRSYISYTAYGVKYTNVEYQDVTKRSDLVAKGKTLTVEVSPEDPGKLISELANSQGMLGVMIPFTCFFLMLVWNSVINGKRSRNNPDSPDKETVARDLKLTILSRRFPVMCLLVCVGYGLMYWRYGRFIGNWCPVVIAILGAGWLLDVFRAIRDWGAVKREEYELRRDKLIQKEHTTDGDNDDVYYLHYSNGSSTWKKQVNLKKFTEAVVGTTLLAVYLPGKKKPAYHYDEAGDAQG